MKLVSNFNERFKEAFGHRNVTDFATEIGVSKQTVSAYLNGVRKPKPIVSAEIARKLNVNPAWLLGYDVEKEMPNVKAEAFEDFSELTEKYNKLSEEDQKRIMDYIDRLSR